MDFARVTPPISTSSVLRHTTKILYQKAKAAAYNYRGKGTTSRVQVRDNLPDINFLEKVCWGLLQWT